MSPVMLRALDPGVSFPRVSGDEPVSESGKDLVNAFSPRERG